MGGVADNSIRSSSPLKRLASDLDMDGSDQTEDVDMVNASDSHSPLASHARAQSVDMLNENTPSSTAEELDPQRLSPPLSETELPPIDIQINAVTTMCKANDQQPMKENDKAYLISKRWLDRVIARGSEARKHSKEEPEGEIGPIDNSDLIQEIIKDSDGVEFAQLKPGLGQESYQFFPVGVWEMVVQWYGIMPGSVPILRYAHNTNEDKQGLPNIIYELYPPILRIHRLWSEVSGIPLPQKLKVGNPLAPVFIVQRTLRYNDFLKKAKTTVGIDLNKKVRVWRVPRRQPAAEPAPTTASISTPPSSRPSSPSPAVPQEGSQALSQEPQDNWTHLLLDVATFTKLNKGDGRELVPADDNTHNIKFNGGRDLGFLGISDNQAIVLDEQLSGNDSFVSNGKASAFKNSTTSYISSQVNSGRTSPAPSGNSTSIMTRGRARATGRTPGTVGLSNLGNTCYMNSALQCIRSVEELTKYFLTGNAEKELNYENPLGNHGEVAKAYDKLLREIYADPVPTSVGPRHFKSVIGKYAPSFSGYGQQDSQEFIGFLLDGLQEDLSRIKKKPYIEKPDSTDEMVNDLEAIRKMAKTVWDITKKRDDSVIADLFTGMYKSTLVCPECDKVSITFDPFNNLTLQLPIETTWAHEIYYVPMNDKMFKLPVDLDKQATILALKRYIGAKVGVPAERLMVSEFFKNKFYRNHSDNEIASEVINANDDIAVYELEAVPTNWPPKKQTKKSRNTNFGDSDDEVPTWDDPMADNMLVPVMWRAPNQDKRGGYNRKTRQFEPCQCFIMLTPNEAKNMDVIKRKLLEKVATFTNDPRGLFKDDEDADTESIESVDTDIGLTNESDSSPGGTKITANSIDSEDGMVDVTMKEADEVRPSEGADQTQPKPEIAFNRRRPKFVTDPSSFLNPGLQNIFELRYFRSTKELLPTGWNQIEEDKAYPTLASRLPEVVDEESVHGESESGNDEEAVTSVFSENTRMNDESEDELQADHNTNVLPVRMKPGSRTNFTKFPSLKAQRRALKNQKTYSRKGKKNKGMRRRSMSEQVDGSNDSADEGPLVRLGEAIIVDWTEPAYEALFTGDSLEDTFRGIALYKVVNAYHDEALAAKRKARTQRRRNGITLDECLNEFGKEEVLSEADTWYCPRCKEHRRATKRFELWKTPDILVMHLKRFSSSQYRRDKLDVLVDFPIEGLDLSSRVMESEDGKKEIFDLFAVDDHWGGLGGGHYTAFAKNFFDHEWYEYNDSSVSKVKDESRLVTSSAYLLFYRRRSDVPLGGPKFQEIVNTFEKSPEASEDEVTESGEDQSLAAANSSPRGSSSASIGVGAAHHQNGSHFQTETVNLREVEQLPAYQSHDSKDAIMSDTLPLRNSIEDEGIGMGDDSPQNTSLGDHLKPTFSFAALDSNQDSSQDGQEYGIIGTNNLSALNISRSGSPFDEDGSAVVQDDSSAGSREHRERLVEWEETVAEDDEGIPFEEPSPVPDVVDNRIDPLELSKLLSNQRHSYNALAGDEEVEDSSLFVVPAEGVAEDIEEPATDIHVE